MGNYKLPKKAENDLAEMYEFGIYKFSLLNAQKYFFRNARCISST